MKIIHPLRHPEMYEAYGKQVGGGILMYGPPGCGKTYLARATAGEIGAGFISVGHQRRAGHVDRPQRAESAALVRAGPLQPAVRAVLRRGRCLGGRRSDMSSGSRPAADQPVPGRDGWGRSDSNEGVLVLAATNAPWHVDPAFRRPGRFDRVLFVAPPDAAARAEILRMQLRGKAAGHDRLAHSGQEAPRIFPGPI